MKKKRLITSALPYVNNIPHLGNLLQVLSADVFARYCRERGYETLYVCGTDEYGTATETKAAAEGVTPQQLCDRFHAVHQAIYQWFQIDFDTFGRTSTPKQTEIVQSIFKAVDAAGYITEQTTRQLYCDSCGRFLADRYVMGTCPHCGSTDARGDQCDACGHLLDPTDLIDPKCSSCRHTPVLKATRHLYLDLPKALPLLEKWMEGASKKGFWANNAIQITKSWIRDGLKARCITRDLKWGIPVPKKGFEDKVFYVWFDAPIGYISITANYTDQWKSWWQNPDEVELYQFIGKDNIPFHTVIFPASLLASGQPWTLLHHMSSTEYLNYENGKFSKSRGTGVFGNDAQETGIPSDVWRFYLFYNRPEKNDVLFTWKDFQEKVNKELIGNFGNLVNRTLTFVHRFYNDTVPEGTTDRRLSEQFHASIEAIDRLYDRADLRDAVRAVLELSDLGNKAFQEGEPWKLRTEDPDRAAALLRALIYLIRDLAVLIAPVMPTTAKKIAGFCGNASLSWDSIGKEDFTHLNPPEILFTQLDDRQIDALRTRYAGTATDPASASDPQAPRRAGKADPLRPAAAASASLARRFTEQVSLTVGKIIEIRRHPDADRLYIEKIDLGGGVVRQIVSGLVPYYSESELLNRLVVVVDNLKPSSFRGVLSEGMLLAAEGLPSEGGEPPLSLLSVEGVRPGDKVGVNGFALPDSAPPLKADAFFRFPITVEHHQVVVDGRPLSCGSLPLTSSIETGRVR